MRVLKVFFRMTLIYKLYMLLVSLYSYINDYSYASDVIYNQDFKDLLKKYLNTDFKKDWIGRLYGVINPNIDINGNFDFSSQIFEIDGPNTNNNEFVHQWIYKQMILVSDLFDIQKTGLFDIIGMDIKHVGPKNHDNYLVVIDFVNRRETVLWLKKFFKHLLCYAVIAFCISVWIL